MKRGDIGQLVGQTIRSFEQNRGYLSITCDDGRRFDFLLDDDGCGGNDSHVSLGDVSLSALLGRAITAAREEDSDSYGATFVLEAGDTRGFIVVNHEHNGYYGWSYDLVEFKP